MDKTENVTVMSTPTTQHALSQREEQVLALIRSRDEIPIEMIVERFGGNEIVSIIRRLISMGYVSLVILWYPWGTEIDLKAANRHSTKARGEECG
jgi:hypothetical protein